MVSCDWRDILSNHYRYQAMSLKKRESKRQELKGASPADDFASVARRLECDEDKERFEERLGKIAAYKPKAEQKQKKPSKSGE